jgi:hypothetical protein
VATPATAVEPPAAGVSDDTPLDLPWPDPASGHLEPEQVAWYRWVLSGDAAQPMSSSFTLFFTPGDSLFADRVLCEVMTVAQRDARLSGQGTANTGAGTIVSRDGDPLTGERFWSGHLVAGEVYIVRIANASDVPIDYWLFPGDIIHPVFPPPVEPAATPEPTMTFTPAAPLPTSTPTAQPATATPAAAVTRAATATATPLSPAKTPTPTPTPVLPSDLVPSSEQSKATDWEDWHVALTCVTHCDQN